MDARGIRLGLWGLVAGSALLCAAAQQDAGPPKESVTIVEAYPVTPAVLEQLAAEGYTIDSRDGDRVRLYVSGVELAALKGMGLEIRILGYQPEPYAFTPGAKGLGVYHNYEALTAELQTYAQAFPDICRLDALGTSVQGRTLWAMRITDHPDIEEDEPEVKYISTMHGDEPVGTELCLYFIDRLLNGYAADSRIRQLVDETDIWIVPLMNPDGLEIGWRYNANSKDLNRSFPNYPNQYSGTVFDGTQNWASYPAEVAIIGQWTAARHFVLSANFHTGSAVVNYPYDNDGRGSVDSPTPDDALIEELSRSYSRTNPTLWNSTAFPQGITNGAAWYAITGGMQDWNYRYTGCIDVTIELSTVKRPAATALPGLWTNNKESMLAYLESVHQGVRGVARDARTDLPVYAKVTVTGNTQPVFGDPQTGGYYRLLLPGTYTLSVDAPGYVKQTIAGVTVAAGAATQADVTLQPLPRPHSADLNGDFAIQREEMMAVVTLYQAGAYHWTGSGYAPGPGPHTGPPHASDYAPQDWRIDMHELLRLIQLYNSGGYTDCWQQQPPTEDRYCPLTPAQ